MWVYSRVIYVCVRGIFAGSKAWLLKILKDTLSSSSDTGAHKPEQSLPFSSFCLHCPIFPPPSSLLSWLQLYLCALGRLQRVALWGDAAAEIRLDPAEERREQVGQQRHPAVPRISGCRAVPPSPTPTHTSSEHPYPTQAHTQTNTIPCQNTNTVTPTKQQWGNKHMSKTASVEILPTQSNVHHWNHSYGGSMLAEVIKATQIITTHKHSSKCFIKALCWY